MFEIARTAGVDKTKTHCLFPKGSKGPDLYTKPRSIKKDQMRAFIILGFFSEREVEHVAVT